MAEFMDINTPLTSNESSSDEGGDDLEKGEIRFPLNSSTVQRNSTEIGTSGDSSGNDKHGKRQIVWCADSVSKRLKSGAESSRNVERYSLNQGKESESADTLSQVSNANDPKQIDGAFAMPDLTSQRSIRHPTRTIIVRSSGATAHPSIIKVNTTTTGGFLLPPNLKPNLANIPKILSTVNDKASATPDSGRQCVTPSCSCHKDVIDIRRDLQRIESKVDALHAAISDFVQLQSGQIFPQPIIMDNDSLPVTTTDCDQSAAGTKAPVIMSAFSTKISSGISRAITLISNGEADDLKYGVKFDSENCQYANEILAVNGAGHDEVQPVEARITVSSSAAGSSGTADFDAASSKCDGESWKLGFDSSVFKAVARAILLFTGKGITVEHLKEYGPTWLARISEDEIREIINRLVKQKVLKKLGIYEIPWAMSGGTTKLMDVYSKLVPISPSDTSLEKQYGITRRAYNAAIRHKPTHHTLHLNRICEDALTSKKRFKALKSPEAVPVDDDDSEGS